MKKLLFIITAIISLFLFSNAQTTPPTIQWQNSLGGTGDDYAFSIQQTNNSGYIVSGCSISNDGDVTGSHGNNDYWVVKLDLSGNIQWQKSLGGTGDDNAFSIQQTNDGSYIVAGNSSSNDGDVTGNHGYPDYWVVKLDSSGNLQWQKSLGGSLYDLATSIQQTNDGGYIVSGFSQSNDGDVTGHHGNSCPDAWVVKLSKTTLGIKEQKIYNIVSIYLTNPTNGILNIENAENSKITIYNLLGEVVLKTKCNSAFSTINVSGLAEGTYIVKVVSEKNIVTKKICVIK